jgi:hypothetical protein
VEDDAEFTHNPYVVRVHGSNTEQLIAVGQEFVFPELCPSPCIRRGAGKKAKKGNETRKQAWVSRRRGLLPVLHLPLPSGFRVFDLVFGWFATIEKLILQ